MPAPKSFYHLAFSVGRGGASKDLHVVRGTLAALRGDLEAELAEGINLYLLCWYGAELELDVFQNGERVQTIDLHPFLEIAIEGYPPITFDAQGTPVGYDFGADDEATVAEGSLSARMFAGETNDITRVTVAWDRMQVPMLEGDIVGDDDVVTIEGDWREGEDASRDELLEDGWFAIGAIDLEA